MRPVGAILVSRASDRFEAAVHTDGGRRPVFGARLHTRGFAPSLTVLLILRTLYGVATRPNGKVSTRVAGKWRTYSAACPQPRYQTAAIRMPDELYSGLDRLWRAVPLYRLLPRIPWSASFPRSSCSISGVTVQDPLSWNSVNEKRQLNTGNSWTIVKSHWRLKLHAVRADDRLQRCFSHAAPGTSTRPLSRSRHSVSPPCRQIIAVIPSIERDLRRHFHRHDVRPTSVL